MGELLRQIGQVETADNVFVMRKMTRGSQRR